MISDTLQSLSNDALLDWLRAKRWFGAKASARAARVENVIVLDGITPACAIVRVAVELDDGSTVQYQLPLAEHGGGRDALGGTLVDAVTVPEFRDAIGAAFAHGKRFGDAAHAWVIEPVGSGADLRDASSRAGSAEQSNSSVLFGDRAILKLFRRLEAGVHPDAELSRVLTERTSFENTPPLLGLVTFDDGGSRTVAGMLSALVPGARDAWEYALEKAREYFKDTDPDAKDPFVDDARALGRATRALHEALASVTDDPDVAPERATEDDVEQWADAARDEIERAMSLLDARIDSLNKLDAQSAAAARALLGRRTALEDRLDEIADDVGDDAGMRIRHHGDYHLGQVLRGADGRWMIIDFEGEPSRSLEERRAKNSPLRDVAGMLRSFAYCAATVASETRKNAMDPRVELKSARFERNARMAFLDGYFSEPERPSPTRILPHERDDSSALLSLFEIQKTFYELSYELNNRPAWAWIPLRGIARML